MIADNFRPQYLIKVSEKKEYSEEIINGRIYMKESGYYRKLDDNYREDAFDGKYPVDIEKSRIRINGRNLMEIKPLISSMTIGFEYDDKLPIFCSTLLDQDILINKDDDKYCIKKEVIYELSKFGDYVVIIDINEFIYKMVQYADLNELYIKYGNVKYSETERKFLFSIIDNKDSNQLNVFFEKEQSYKFQNEWRVVLTDKDFSLIDKDVDYVTVNIGHLESAISIKTSDLHTLELIKDKNL